jgi:hypothetical protein
MHGQWDRAQKAGVALVESFFAGDPVTGRKVRLHSFRLAA